METALSDDTELSLEMTAGGGGGTNAAVDDNCDA